MRVAVYAGSFDPFTRGHGSIVSGAIRTFDRVVIGIGRNSSKSSQYFSLQERQEIIQAFVDEDFQRDQVRPQVEVFDGLLIRFCETLLNRLIDNTLPDSVTIVRGLRAVSDLESEMAIADANRRLSSRFQTVFIPTEANLAFVSSSIVRELRAHNVPLGELTHYLLPSTVSYLATHAIR